MKREDIEYGEKKVELTRLYPFGETTEVDGKKVTVVRLKELNGHDNVAMAREIESGKMAGYIQISASAGIDYTDALDLADKDSNLLAEALQDF